jgi:hypothetical protein
MAPSEGACMHWHKLFCFLRALPTYQQIVAAILFFGGIVLMMRRVLYGWVINRIEDAREEKKADLRREGKANWPTVPEEWAVSASRFILIPLGVWKWLANRARKWERRRKRSKAS